MKIAINTLPLKTAHKGRGIGYYTGHLLEALKDEGVKVVEFTNLSEVGSVSPHPARQKKISHSCNHS